MRRDHEALSMPNSADLWPARDADEAPEEIPLEARIILVCDAFHAMTTDRPYRKRLPLEDVFVDFRENTGTQFAPEVICAFCRAFLREIEGTAKERRLMKLLGRNYDNVEAVGPLLSRMISDLDGATIAATASSH